MTFVYAIMIDKYYLQFFLLLLKQLTSILFAITVDDFSYTIIFDNFCMPYATFVYTITVDGVFKQYYNEQQLLHD